MRRFIRWALWILLALLVIVVGAWWLSRMLGPTAEQKTALAMLGKESAVRGSNAFPALWSLPYDVPEDMQQAVAAEDAKRFGALPASPSGEFLSAQASTSVAAARYADLTPSEADWSKFCKSRTAGCLESVRADRGGYAALLARNARLVERSIALRQYGHYRNGLPLRNDGPMPPFHYAIAPLTRHALDFADGRQDAALAGVCQDAAAWRRIGSHGDSLIARMIGIAYATDGYGRLFADMLAELPAGHRLPPVCISAFAVPVLEEGLICEAMKGESKFVAEGMRALYDASSPVGDPIGDFLFPVLFDEEMTLARMAPSQAHACSDEVRHSVQADTPIKPLPATPLNRGFDCVGNYVGCLLAHVGTEGGPYDRYALRGQDYVARLRLIATLLWLREQEGDGTSIEQRLRERPRALVAPGHPVEVADGGRSLRIRHFDDSNDAYWQVPIAAADVRRPDAAAGDQAGSSVGFSRLRRT
ncbi:hypothetical protein M2650_00445 [Luteimonas sp. SX5]|uniref:Uncharacterized protein n=1 Tax=Luteimonas galliterrae TaxID=2940486 RepID=A0ABT0ME32_9GAMM|nr:hypothetical protein [Luteimonas galliterrae]MCL1633120.1 hypothetical protein [Luteimonas galliterrae]